MNYLKRVGAYGARGNTWRFDGTKDEYIVLLKKAIQWHLWEEKASDYECSFCAFEGSGDKVLPESVREKYGSGRDCPDEVYWVAKTWEDENPEDEDGEPIEVPWEEKYEGHAVDCNGVCNYDLINAECNFEEDGNL